MKTNQTDITNQHLIETKQSSQAIFDGKLIQVFVDTVTLPNGLSATREIVRHCPAVCVLAITKQDQVVLVRQFRYPVDKPLLEIPAGKMDLENESPADCALRELAEETPYTTSGVSLLHTFYTAPGFCDELMYLFQTQDLKADSQISADEDEFIDTVLYSRQQVKQALQNNEFSDAKTLIALQYWLLNT